MALDFLTGVNRYFSPQQRLEQASDVLTGMRANLLNRTYGQQGQPQAAMALPGPAPMNTAQAQMPVQQAPTGISPLAATAQMPLPGMFDEALSQTGLANLLSTTQVQNEPLIMAQQQQQQQLPQQTQYSGIGYQQPYGYYQPQQAQQVNTAAQYGQYNQYGGLLW